MELTLSEEYPKVNICNDFLKKVITITIKYGEEAISIDEAIDMLYLEKQKREDSLKKVEVHEDG